MKKLPESLLQAINTKRAILFTGAGFSRNCVNFNNEKLPNSTELANKIGKLTNFDAEGDLKFAVEFFLKNDGNKVDLIKLLKDIFTINQTTEVQQKISRLPWMRCYTTNYDNSIELAGQQVGKKYDSINVDDSPLDFSRESDVVHINGAITRLNESNLETSFKLSNSSYLSDIGFKQSPWFRNFEQDLDRCSAIIFIGYSLYDFEIEKFLSNRKNLKVYFITPDKLSQRERFKYETYGTVLPIEAKGFSDLISELEIVEIEEKITSFNLIDINLKTSIEPTDDDVKKLFIYGTISNDIAASSLIGIYENQYIIRRTLESEIEKTLKNNIIITGELGSGKTLFLMQLGMNLSKKGFNVYDLVDIYGSVYTDIDRISKNSGRSILLIDNYNICPEILQYIGNNYSPEKILVIATCRPSAHTQLKDFLKISNFKYDFHSINSLSEEDAKNIAVITNTIGAWDLLAAETLSRKVKYILEKTPTFSLYLLKIFKSKTIKERIDKDLGLLVANDEVKETIFAICVLTLAGVSATFSLIQEISGSGVIRKSDRDNGLIFNDIFKVKDYDNIILSSFFAQFFLNTQFTASEITSRFLLIAEQFENKKTVSKINEIIFKHVLKFSSLERALPDEQKKNSFEKYYENLKRRITWLQTDPHFWLQYGMAKISLKEFNDAQAYLNNAYKFAEKNNLSMM